MVTKKNFLKGRKRIQWKERLRLQFNRNPYKIHAEKCSKKKNALKNALKNGRAKRTRKKWFVPNDGRKKDRKIGKIEKSRYSSRYISVIDENFSKWITWNRCGVAAASMNMVAESERWKRGVSIGRNRQNAPSGANSVIPFPATG